MKNSYYISQNGDLMKNVILGETYILISCGSKISYRKEKVKELLSNDITYTVDLIEQSIAEIHHARNFLNRGGYLKTKNIPSKLTIEAFLKLIK